MTESENEKTKAEMGAAFESIQSRLRKIESALTLIRSQGDIDIQKISARAPRRRQHAQEV